MKIKIEQDNRLCLANVNLIIKQMHNLMKLQK